MRQPPRTSCHYRKKGEAGAPPSTDPEDVQAKKKESGHGERMFFQQMVHEIKEDLAGEWKLESEGMRGWPHPRQGVFGDG